MKMPETIGLVHFIGIGGIGMSGIAEVLANLGYRVQGSDQSDGANVQRLREKGIECFVGHKAENLGQAARYYRGAFDLIPTPDFVQMQDSFGHLNGYSAIYYTYRWSKVIADDLFTRFEKDGLRDPETAKEYRERVLAKGGTEPAAQLVKDFLGRDISLDAYRADMAKAAQ